MARRLSGSCARRASADARADERLRLPTVRLEALRGFLLSRRSFWRSANDTVRALVFVLTDCCRDSPDVEVVRLAKVLSNSVQLVKNGVLAFHRELPAGSSSGVQIIGGVRPAERQMASIVPRIVAFAMCLQFHVNK